MKICYIAPSSSVHTKKWCAYFLQEGHEVHVVTFDEGLIDGAIVHRLRQRANAKSSDLGKLGYLTCIRQLRRMLDDISPDIIHAHYASSYGTLCALACNAPYYLSIWGSDIYDFPKKSLLHRALLSYSLKHAAVLMSTSSAMAKEASAYTERSFEITPFGVDVRLFCPGSTLLDPSFFTVGTVKGLAKKYGIHDLIDGCAKALEARPDMPLRVRIAGTGPEERALKDQAAKIGIADRIEWLGFVDPDEVPNVWRSLDLAIIPSESESFGVSAVEAQACGVPLIVTDIPGLMEATCPDSRVVVPRSKSNAIAEAILLLFQDREKRLSMGKQGRQYVVDNLALEDCFSRIEEIYSRGFEG